MIRAGTGFEPVERRAVRERRRGDFRHPARRPDLRAHAAGGDEAPCQPCRAAVNTSSMSRALAGIAACRGFGSRNTRHESRLLSAPHPSRLRATAAPPPEVLGSRNTRHETRITAFSRPFSGLSPKPPESHGRPACRVFGSRNTRHETRITAFSTRITAFPPSRPRATAAPTPRAFRGHETRITRHESRLFSETRNTKHETRGY